MTRKVTIEPLEQRRLLSADWQNPLRLRDVSGDGFVSAVDALSGIARLNDRNTAKDLGAVDRNANDPFYDVNGDDFHSPIDVLLVIDGLNNGPILNASLANDSGMGTGAEEDALTLDASMDLQWNGQAGYLALRLADRVGESSEWLDASNLLLDESGLHLSTEVLDGLFGQMADGSYELFLRVGKSEQDAFPDSTSVRFELDRTRPTSRFYSDITMASSSEIVIPFLGQVEASTLDATRVHLFDASWGENADKSFFTGATDHPRFPMEPESVSIAPDGKHLIIEPPANSRPISYIVELEAGVVQDKAGNAFEAFESETGVYRANYFPHASQSLPFGNTIRTEIQFDAAISEFQFEVSDTESIFWTGDRDFGSLTTFELYHDGSLLYRFEPSDRLNEPSDANQPRLLTLTPGHYRFRIVSPPAGGSRFRLYRVNDLPPIPESRSRGNGDPLWDTDAYAVELEAEQRVYIQHRDTDAARIVDLAYKPDGQRAIVLAGEGSDQFIEAESAGTYFIQNFRRGYSSFVSTPTTESIDVNEWIGWQIAAPGQVKHFHFQTTPGKIYLVNFLQLDTGLQSEFSVSQTGSFDVSDQRAVFVATEDSGELSLSWMRPLEGSRYHFRIEELTPMEPEFGMDLPAIPRGETAAFWIDAEKGRVNTRGDQEYRFVTFNETRSTQPASDSGWIRGDTEFFSNGLRGILIVRGTESNSTWRLEEPQVLSAPLEYGSETSVDFVTGLETFEYTFSAQAGQFLEIQALQSSLQNYRVSIEHINGTVLSPSEHADFLYLFEFAGDYRILAQSSDSLPGSLSLLVNSPDQWRDLPGDTTVTVLDTVGREIFKLPHIPGNDFVFLHSLSARTDAEWRVLDSQGRLLRRGSAAEGSANRPTILQAGMRGE